MKVVVSLLLAMLCSIPALAQTSADATDTASPNHRLKLPMLVWVAGAASDQITTYRFSSQYGGMIREQNPMIRGLDRHPVALVTAGAALDAASGWLSYKVLRNHPRIAQAVFYGAASYRAYLAVHNMHMMQVAEDIRSRSQVAGSMPLP